MNKEPEIKPLPDGSLWERHFGAKNARKAKELATICGWRYEWIENANGLHKPLRRSDCIIIRPKEYAVPVHRPSPMWPADDPAEFGKLLRRFDFLDLVAYLGEHITIPVSLRFARLKGKDGDCERVKGRFVIRLNKTLSERQLIDTLIHEWAHGLAWGLEEDFHGEKWGIAYSKVYRAFLKWQESRLACQRAS